MLMKSLAEASESKSTVSIASTDDKTAIIYPLYKPLTIRALMLTTMHLHITNSCAVRIKHHIHYPIFMACTGAVVISVMSDPYTF